MPPHSPDPAYSPPPWQVEGLLTAHPVIYGMNERGERIPLAQVLNETDGTGERMGNAMVMTLAPEFVAALEHLLECCELNMEDLEPETILTVAKARSLLSRLIL